LSGRLVDEALGRPRLRAFLASRFAAQSVRGRLEGRIPSAAIPAVDSLIQFASQEGLFPPSR